MAILDVGPYQQWIVAHDNWERAKRRFDAAGAIGNVGLIDYLRDEVDKAAYAFNAATRAINGR